MARLPRLALAGHMHLLIQRGHDGRPVFRDADDFAAYLGHLREAARAHGVAVHAFALLEAEVLLVATPADAPALSRMMQAIGRHFVPAYNRRHRRSGALWEGRFASTVVDAETHGIACLRLVETAPAQVGAVASAVDYCWSSALHHSGRLALPWISDHPLFWQLGNTPFEREARWQQLLEQPMTPQERNLLRDSAVGGWVLGGAAFKALLEGQTSRRLAKRLPGRPVKHSTTRPNTAKCCVPE